MPPRWEGTGHLTPSGAWPGELNALKAKRLRVAMPGRVGVHAWLSKGHYDPVGSSGRMAPATRRDPRVLWDAIGPGEDLAESRPQG